jgi:hypothetical protein
MVFLIEYASLLNLLRQQRNIRGRQASLSLDTGHGKASGNQRTVARQSDMF